jgi:hypothetical protein
MFCPGIMTLDILRMEKVEACFLNHFQGHVHILGKKDAFLLCLLCLLKITWIMGLARHQPDFPWQFITMCEHRYLVFT